MPDQQRDVAQLPGLLVVGHSASDRQRKLGPARHVDRGTDLTEVGDVGLDMYVWETTLPILGKVKAGTALIFDLGVTVIVLGLIAAVLDGLGADELRGSDEPDLAVGPEAST